MEVIHFLAQNIFEINNIWSLVFRGLIWSMICLLILIAVDAPDFEESHKNVKFYLGFFIAFIIISTSLFYLLFGFAPV